MQILEARIETERPSRYLVQFCKHAAAMGGGDHSPRMHLHGMTSRRDVQVKAEWSDARGTVTFTPWGQCTIAADGKTLTVRIEAGDEDGMRQIRDVISRDLERFSRRDPLAVNWHRPDTPGAAPGTPAEDRGPMPERRRGAATRWMRTNLQTVVLAVAVVLVVSLHLGLAGLHHETLGQAPAHEDRGPE
jgi:hypothetical protein